MTARPTARPRALALLAAAAAATLGLAGCAAGAETTASRRTRRRRNDRLRPPAGAGLRVRRLDRAGLPQLQRARQPRLARRGPPGRALARRGVERERRRPAVDLRAEVRREVHRRLRPDRRGRRVQLRPLGGQRRQQHRARVARRLLRVGDRGRRAHAAGQPLEALPAPGRQPHAGLLRHPVAAGPRDPHRRGELRGADRHRRVHRGPLGSRAADRAEGQPRLHVAARQRRAHRPGLRRRGDLEVRRRPDDPRRRAEER